MGLLEFGPGTLLAEFKKGENAHVGDSRELDRRADGGWTSAVGAGDRRGASSRGKSAVFDVVTNIMALVKSLGGVGLMGLIALAVISWLFSGRKIA